MATTDTERRVFELSAPPGGGRPERALRISFGDFLARVLAAPEPAAVEELADLAAGAAQRGCVRQRGRMLGIRQRGAPLGRPATSAASLDAHQLGYEDYDPLYGLDPEGRRLALMMRLTDHLDPEGHAFDSILESVMAAEPTEDPQPDRVGGLW